MVDNPDLEDREASIAACLEGTEDWILLLSVVAFVVAEDSLTVGFKGTEDWILVLEGSRFLVRGLLEITTLGRGAVGIEG